MPYLLGILSKATISSKCFKLFVTGYMCEMKLTFFLLELNFSNSILIGSNLSTCTLSCLVHISSLPYQTMEYKKVVFSYTWSLHQTRYAFWQCADFEYTIRDVFCPSRKVSIFTVDSLLSSKRTHLLKIGILYSLHSKTKSFNSSMIRSIKVAQIHMNSFPDSSEIQATSISTRLVVFTSLCLLKF